jgi:hypothetical protein
MEREDHQHDLLAFTSDASDAKRSSPASQPEHSGETRFGP